MGTHNTCNDDQIHIIMKPKTDLLVLEYYSKYPVIPNKNMCQENKTRQKNDALVSSLCGTSFL